MQNLCGNSIGTMDKDTNKKAISQCIVRHLVLISHLFNCENQKKEIGKPSKLMSTRFLLSLRILIKSRLPLKTIGPYLATIN